MPERVTLLGCLPDCLIAKRQTVKVMSDKEQKAADHTKVDILNTLRDSGRLNYDALDQVASYEGDEDTGFIGKFLKAVGHSAECFAASFRSSLVILN